jgi:hypothetical protein
MGKERQFSSVGQWAERGRWERDPSHFAAMNLELFKKKGLIFLYDYNKRQRTFDFQFSH